MMIFIFIIILLFTVGLVVFQSTYKSCSTYSATKYGESDYPRIKGVTYSLPKMYSDSPVFSCSQTDKRNIIYYEELGNYSEEKSCKTEENNKSYITTKYTKCPFGCYGGLCMDKCYDSDNSDSADTLTKGEVIGLRLTDSATIAPGVVPKESREDYCTNENNTFENLSSSLAEQTCGDNNFIEELISKCDTFCFDGACQEENTTQCFDSDAEDRGKNSGEVKYYDLKKKEIITKPDSCLNSKTVVENFCDANKTPRKMFLTCRNECIEGTCVQ